MITKKELIELNKESVLSLLNKDDVNLYIGEDRYVVEADSSMYYAPIDCPIDRVCVNHADFVSTIKAIRGEIADIHIESNSLVLSSKSSTAKLAINVENHYVVPVTKGIEPISISESTLYNMVMSSTCSSAVESDLVAQYILHEDNQFFSTDTYRICKVDDADNSLPRFLIHNKAVKFLSIFKPCFIGFGDGFILFANQSKAKYFVNTLSDNEEFLVSNKPPCPLIFDEQDFTDGTTLPRMSDFKDVLNTCKTLSKQKDGAELVVIGKTDMESDITVKGSTFDGSSFECSIENCDHIPAFSVTVDPVILLKTLKSCGDEVVFSINDAYIRCHDNNNHTTILQGIQ